MTEINIQVNNCNHETQALTIKLKKIPVKMAGWELGVKEGLWEQLWREADMDGAIDAGTLYV